MPIWQVLSIKLTVQTYSEPYSTRAQRGYSNFQMPSLDLFMHLASFRTTSENPAAPFPMAVLSNMPMKQAL